MKFFPLLVVVVIAVVVYFLFFGNLNRPANPIENNKISSPIENSKAPSSTTTKNPTPTITPVKNSSGTKNSVPSGFRGPTGKPHIIGPSGPPPNY